MIQLSESTYILLDSGEYTPAYQMIRNQVESKLGDSANLSISTDTPNNLKFPALITVTDVILNGVRTEFADISAPIGHSSHSITRISVDLRVRVESLAPEVQELIQQKTKFKYFIQSLPECLTESKQPDTFVPVGISEASAENADIEVTYKDGGASLTEFFQDWFTRVHESRSSEDTDLYPIAAYPDPSDPLTVTLSFSELESQSAETGENGYVAVQLDPLDAGIINDWLKRTGVKGFIDPSSLHATLFYAKNGMSVLPDIDPNKVYSASVGTEPHFEVMGENPWRAIVLHLNAPELAARHEQIKEITGAEHSYPDFKAHLSFKYSPVEGDFEKILAEPFPITSLRFTGEKQEDIDA